MRPVTVQFLKYPDILHWGFETRFLGEDDYGTWVWLPQGSRRWKGEQPVRPAVAPAVMCAPRDGWWHLHFNGDDTDFSHFIDITTVPAWVAEDRYEMVDLDLDVVVRQDGTVEVEDEDEFAVHQVKYGYTTEMIERAIVETGTVVRSLEAGSEPFFEVAAAWLARARDAGPEVFSPPGEGSPPRPG